MINLKHWLFLLVVSLPILLYAQTGPGGVGDRQTFNTGTNPGDGLSIWVVADSATFNGSNEVITLPNLADVAGLGFGTTVVAPTYIPNALNGHAEISFADVVDALESQSAVDATTFPSNVATILYVLRHDNNEQRSSSYQTGTDGDSGSGSNRVGAHNPWNGEVFSDVGDCGCAINNTDDDGRIVADYQDEWVGQYGIWISRHNTSLKELFRDQLIQSQAINSAFTPFNQYGTTNFYLGHTSTDNFQGDLAEMVMFKTDVNDAQLDILRNYFAAKYDLDIANDYYLFQASHGVDVIGIGQTGSDTHLESKSAGTLTIKGATSIDTDGDFVFAGHDNANGTSWTTSEQINGDSNLERIAREWRFDATGNPGTITISIDPTNLPAFNADFGFHTLWVDDDGDFTNGATQYPLTFNGTTSEYEASGITVTDGMYVTIGAYRPEINFVQTSFSGKEDAGDAVFEVAMAYAVDANVTVDYAVSGTCTEDLPSAGTFTIAAGATSTSLNVPITSGDAFETDETIILTLTGGSQSHGTLGTTTVSTYTVLDDGTNAANTVQIDAPFGYGFKKSVTVNSSMVSGSNDLTDFPVLIKFTDPQLATIGNGGNVEHVNGYDIRFTYQDDLTFLDHEIEYYDQTTGEYVAWVRLPVFSASENTILDMYYGNSSITTDPSTTGVWVDYHVVFHMSDNDDSSPNGYDGTIQAGSTDIEADAIAGRSQFFDGNDVFQISNSMPELNTEFTISMWMKTDNISNNARLFHDDNGGQGYAFSLGDGGAGNIRSFQRGFSGAGIIDAVNTLSQDTWYHLNFVVDRTNFHRIIYVDGASDISDLSDNSGSTWQTHTGTNGNVTIGGEDNTTSRRHIGNFDEVRVSSVVRNADWIATEFNSMDPSTNYLTFGSQSVVPPLVVGEDADSVNLTIALSGLDANDVAIDYAITGGTASSGTDYVLAAGTATITAGNLSTIVTIDITDDAQDETDETLTVSLSNPVSTSDVSLGADNEIEITILDNDDGPTIAASDTIIFVNEGSDLSIWTVDLSASSGQSITVDYTIADISATSGTDYILSSGTLTVPVDSTSAEVGFNIIDDEIIELGETFSITLSNPVNGLLDADFDEIIVTINDNDNFGIDGPGGVGDADGSGTLVMWMIADSVTNTGNNTDATYWENEINNPGLDMQPDIANPTYVENIANGHAAVSFSSTVNDRMTSVDNLSVATFPFNEGTAFIVTTHDNLFQQSTVYGTINMGTRFNSHMPWNGNAFFDIGTCCTPRIQFTYLNEWVGEPSLFSNVVSASGVNVGQRAYRNGVLVGSDNDVGTVLDHTSGKFTLGRASVDNFAGDIMEYIMYTSPVNAAQRIITENYLAAKYGLSITNDFYSFQASHSAEVIGIGQEDSENFHTAAKTGLITISNASDLGDGDYVFVGHDNQSISAWGTTDVPADLNNIQRIEREFRVDVTGSPGTISVAIDASLLPTLPTDFTEYVLLTDDDGVFSAGATIYAMTEVSGEFIANNIEIAQGTYFTIATHRRTIEFSQNALQGVESTNNTISLTLSVASGSDLSIPYTIAGTATSGADYSIATTGSFVISAGRTDEIIDLGILDESEIETDETIVITLGAAPTGTLLGTNAVFTYTITDDDNQRDIEFRNPCDYGFTKTITIDNTQVDNADGADLINFPLLVSFTDGDLATVANGGNVQNSNGYDIAFTYRDALIWLDHEIERYDETTGEYIAWVLIPTLDFNEDTELSMHYGNSNITTDPSVSSVWSEYVAVWHMGGDVRDSSPNSYGGTDNGTSDVSAKVGNGRDFDGAGDFIELASFPNLQTDFTVTAFVNPDTDENGQRVFIDDDNNSNGYSLSLFDGNNVGRVRFFSRGAGPTSVDFNGSGISASSGWHYVSGVVNVESADGAGSRSIYVDGALGTTGANGNGGWGVDVGSAAIGGETLSGETNNRFNGQMDEVRIYNGLLSAARIATEYNNYNNPSSFYSVGVETASASCLIAENSAEQLEITVAVNPIDNVSATTVTYTATGGTAVNNEDYTLVSGTVTIPAGQQSATFQFPLINDLIDEENETIEISLSNPSINAKVGSESTTTYTISDDDTGPEIGFVDIVSVANEGASVVALTLELGLESGNNVSVDYAVTGGDAVAGTDYIALTGTATVPAGSLTTTISFQPIDDVEIETPETVQITLSNPVNGSLKASFDVHTVTIADNDDLGFEGPGGVGDVENALGENLLKLWLIADSVNFSGSSVTSWNNIIQNVSVDYDMVPVGTAPDVVDNAVNGHKEISFKNLSDALVSEGTLTAASFPGNELSIFIVSETDNLNQNSYAYATDNNVSGTVDANSVSASIPNSAGNAVFDLAGDDFSTTYLPAWAGNHSIFTHIVSSDTFLVYRNNGVLVNRDDANAIFTEHTEFNFYLGKDGTEFYQGDIAEVIMFSRDVNAAQTNLINNYLAAKYDLTISDDLYNFEVSHGVEVAGIGRVDINNQHVAARAGIVTISNADDLDDGEYVLFGHDNGGVSSWTTSEIPSAGIQRTAREWRFDNTGSPGTISIAINADLLPALPNGNEDYIIMTDADGDFTSGATVINTVFVDGQYIANDLSITSGDYVTFGIITRSISFESVALSGSETIAANATVQLSLESSTDVSVDYAITGGTATGSNADYSLAASGQLTFIAGQTTANLPLGIINDSDIESDETIIITLSNSPAGVSLIDEVFTYTINDDDNARNIQFNVDNSSGAESVTNISLQVDLSSVDATNDTKVYYAITGGTAEASPAPDFTFTADTLTIPANQTSGTIDFTILDDVLSEDTETIEISLSSPINANLGANVTHTYSITDNDAAVTVAFQSAATTIDEGGSIAPIVVELSATSGQDVSIDFAVTGGTATGGGTDYSLSAGTLTIAAGDQLGTINVALTDDGIEESAETIILTISNEMGGTLGGQTTHTITLSDNDAAFGFYGPGGVGDNESNMLWLDATAVNGKGVANAMDGASVSTWKDRSGNGNDFTAIGTAPSFDVDAFNLRNTVVVSSSVQGFQSPRGFSNALSNYSFLSVMSQTSGEYLIENNTAATGAFRLGQGATGLYSLDGTNGPVSTSTSEDITTWLFDSQDGSNNAQIFRNGVAVGADNNFQVMAINDNFALGSRDADQTQAAADFGGNISEFIIYRNVLNDAQKIIVENYLANKYDLTIPNDNYAFEGTYGFDIVGIGRANDEQHLQSMSDSLLMISGPSDLDNNEFVFAGHDNGDDLTWTTTEAPSGGSSVRRLAREWRTDITGAPGTIILMIDTLKLPAPPTGFDQYVIWTDDDGDFRSGAVTYQVEYSEIFGFHVSEEVTIASGTYITIGVGQPVVQFSLSDSNGDENNTNPSIEVALNFTLGADATVNYAATGGTATGGNVDYLLESGTITIAEGQSTANISLGIIDDAIEEGDETIQVTLTTPSSNVALGSNTVHTYTINDNDNSEGRTVTFNSAGPGAGSEASAASPIQVQLDINIPDDDVPTTVDLVVISAGSDAADETDDFTLSTSTVTFPADNTTTSMTFDITIVDDVIFEGTETITIQLTNPANADLGAITEYTLDITDDDTAPVAGFTTANSFIGESGGTANIEVSLDMVAVNDVSIDYSVTGTASSGADYTLDDGSLLILAGESSENIQAVIVNDLITESAETITITLDAGINATIGGTTVHVLTINDDDLTGSTGPGGVGDNSGNLLWLIGDNYSGGTWTDVSGNNNDFTGPVSTGTLNNQATITLNGTQTLTRASAISGESDYDIFTVSESIIATDQIIFRGEDATNDLILGFEHASGAYQDQDGVFEGGEISNATPVLIQYKLVSGSGLAEVLTDGAVLSSGIDYTPTEIGANSTIGDGSIGLNGELGELIVYNSGLNDAQETIVQNYLDARYNIGIANDFYAYNGSSSTDFNYNLIGIGRQIGIENLHVTATSEEFLVISNPNNLDDNEYVMIANDGQDMSSWTFTGAPANGSTRIIERDWRVDVTGSPGSISFQIDTTYLPTPPVNGLTWALVVTSDGDFTNIDTTIPLTPISGNVVGVDGLTFNDGDYFKIALVQYQSTGMSNDFNNPMAWTTGVVPTTGTNARIVDGHNLFLSSNSEIGSLTLEGTGSLDLDGYTLELSEGCIELTGSGTIDVSDNNSTIGYTNPNVIEQCVTGMTYNNLFTNGPAGSTKYLTGDIVVTGNVDFESSGGTAAFFDVRNIGTTDDYNIEIEGNWISEITFLPRTGTVTFDGTSTQTINTLGGETFNNLTINKVGATTRTDSTLTMGSNVTTDGTLTLTSGFVDLTSFDFNVNSSSSITGGDERAYFIVDEVGVLRHAVTSTGTLNFPIGDEDDYAPFTFTLNSGTLSNSNVTINMRDAIHTNITESIFISRYWSLENEGIVNPNYNVTYTYTDDDVVGTESRLRARKFSTSGNEIGGSVNAGTNIVTSDTYTTFSDNTAESVEIPLPVTLLSFDGVAEDKIVILNWETAAELNNDRFEIEWSEDGSSFIYIGEVAGNGTTDFRNAYRFIDDQPLPGINYYRFRQVDYDGQFEYSPIIAVIVQEFFEEVTFKVYPNPVTEGKFNINLDGFRVGEEVVLSVMNMSGQKVFNQRIEASDEDQEIYLPQDTPRGIYTIIYQFRNQLKSDKLLIAR
ncbi:MAG: DUF2341 domain-containing protein [Cytophagales bacterium]|nr:DUF2341 domain-containing protein [Cytophagales bacterium]